MIPAPQKCCKHCGALLDENAHFCEDCGQPVAEPAVSPSQPPSFQGVPQPPASAQYVSIPSLPQTDLPAIPAPKKRSNTCLIAGLGLLVGVLCLCVAGIGGYFIYQQFAPPASVSLPSATKPVVSPSNVLPTTDAAPQATQAFSQSDGDPISVAELPNLVLGPDEISSGWSSEKASYSGQDNETYVKNLDHPEEVLKKFNDWGRLTDLVYHYNAPGDQCEITKSALALTVSFDIFKNASGAGEYYTNYGSGEGKTVPGIGEQSLYAHLDQNSDYMNCNKKYTKYYLFFQHFNIYVYTSMKAFTGTMSEASAKNFMVELGKKIDAKIIANAK